jgi:hypothetical protein
MITGHVVSNKLVVSEFYVFVVWPPSNVLVVIQQHTKDGKWGSPWLSHNYFYFCMGQGGLQLRLYLIFKRVFNPCLKQVLHERVNIFFSCNNKVCHFIFQFFLFWIILRGLIDLSNSWKNNLSLKLKRWFWTNIDLILYFLFFCMF